MDLIKKLIPSKKIRFKLISCFRFVPDKPMLRFQYRLKCGRKLNLKEPKRFTEKIQWYKLYYRDPLMAICADKYRVRGYLKEKGYGNLLNEVYTVFDSPDEIDISTLPESFVLKLTNGSGTNLIVRDKSKYSNKEIQALFHDFVKQSAAAAGREWCYHVHKPVIIAEKLLSDLSTENGAADDFKILCFNGEPKVIIRINQRYTEKVNHLTYDTEWNQIKVDFEKSRCNETSEKPRTLNKMLQIARDLSANFPFARVDLYSIQDKIYFGEITFFPWSGYMTFEPDSFDVFLGEKFVLPEKNYRGKNEQYSSQSEDFDYHSRL